MFQLMQLSLPRYFNLIKCNRTQMTFITAPAFIMSPVVIEDAPKTIALGAVATGSMNAYEHVMTEVKTRKIEALSIDYSIMLTNQGDEQPYWSRC